MSNNSRAYSPFRAFLAKFLKQRLAVVATGVVALIVLVGIFGRFLTPYNPVLPVTDQYEEKGVKVTSLSSWLVPLSGQLSDGTAVKAAELEGLSGESERKEIAKSRLDREGLRIGAVTKGTTTVVVRSGDVSAVVEVGVSTEERHAVLSQLSAKPKTDSLQAGEKTVIELNGVMTDGRKLAGAEEIASVLPQAAEDDKKSTDSGFVTSDAAAKHSGITYESTTPAVIDVSEAGEISALKQGSGRVIVRAGDVSSLVFVQVGGAASAEPELTSLQLEESYTQLEDTSKHQAPSSRHLLGTDHANRDIFSRLIAGTQQTLIIGFVSVIIGATIGVLFGLLSGYYGGRLDMLITRGSDILLSFPGMLLAIFVIAVLGPGTINVICAVAIFTVPIFTRIVRGSVLSLREMTYVEAARSIGVRNSVILARHIFPGTVSVVIIYLTMRVGSAILIGAGLSFLGLGADVTAPEWGSMLNAAKNNSHGLFFPLLSPGLAILITVLSFNIMGDGLRDALDPKLKD
ncbi:ABC transporter permease [Paenibacillus sp. GCM10023252]|uniref:ABC transporter permease n=1 Tax=Paenibacillus sp. GCM10023252 TaxID=3252649 RepID=UPI003609B096